jgi:hypothetical protein
MSSKRDFEEMYKDGFFDVCRPVIANLEVRLSQGHKRRIRKM